MLIVSFYTPAYAEHARVLRASCDRFNYAHHIQPRASVGKWVANCNMKPSVVLEALEGAVAPVLWLDADAEILRPLDDLEAITADFAIYQQPDTSTKSRFRSGTVFFRPTADSVALVQDWADRAAKEPIRVWDQGHLCLAWKQSTISTHWLPITYCQRFDEAEAAANLNPVPDPHIVHYQASRFLRRD